MKLFKKRLYIDADSIITPRPSGIGSMTIQLIRELSENKKFTQEHKIILIAPFNKAWLLKRWEFQNVSVIRLPLTGRMIAGLVKYRLMPPIDLFLGSGVYLFPNFRNFPLLFSKSITYIHDVSFKVFPEFVEAKNLPFLLRNVPKWIKRTDIVITVSEHAKKEIIQYYPESEGKISVVYNGINSSFVHHDKYQVKSTLEQYGLAYKNYFMFLSNLEPRKNIIGILSAYKEFIEDPSSKNKDVKLLLVGGMGWNNDSILRKVDELNESGLKVVIPNHYVEDEDLPFLLSGAAALLHPAHYEGFGISPLQAMACGTQVLVSDNTSLPEVVGDAGVYVDSANTNDIRRAMEVVYNKRHDVNTNGVLRAAKFTWKKSARQLAAFVEQLEGVSR